MEIVIAIMIGVWLVLAGVFYGVFVKKEFDRFGVPYSKADVDRIKNTPKQSENK